MSGRIGPPGTRTDGDEPESVCAATIGRALQILAEGCSIFYPSDRDPGFDGIVLKMVYDCMGIDTWGVLDAAATRLFGFMRFNPGPGRGGHCIPLDPSYLSWKCGCLLARRYMFT